MGTRPRITSLCLLLMSLLLAASSSLALDSYPVVVENDVQAKMRDGTVLRADIYRPQAAGKFPILLERTPYNKGDSGDVRFGLRAAAHGYVVVIQDTRGRYASDGEWYPFIHESNDGYDTVEWAATLPYADGKVGMFGGSYVGATQMLAAIAHPLHLAGICPAVTASNYHEGWTYQGGAFEQWFDQNWTTQLARNTLDRLIDKNTDARAGSPVLPLASYPVFNFGQLPAEALLTSTLVPYYGDWLAHPDYDEYWKQWSVEEHFSSIAV